MTFIHSDPEFPDLLRIVAESRQIPVSLIEKDYWVTHTLWALQDLGLEVWFKGGTSLSKGFGLIQRFSEDLDLKLEGGSRELPAVRNWKSKERGPQAARRAFFAAVAALPMVDLQLRMDPASLGERCTNAGIEVRYPGHHMTGLPQAMRPFVLLEVGDARIRPFVECPISSWVHDHLHAQGIAEEFVSNRPASLRCIHPLVTLLEKLDAIGRRFQAGTDPAQYVRHFEDVAHIIQAEASLPRLDDTAAGLVGEMLAQHQVRQVPMAMDPAFLPGSGAAWASVRSAYQAIAPMFWGKRLELEDAAETIRSWISRSL
ncbi:MAG: nucleotidyl transferase AbiEii/AbiGii toxin family protein [Holophaga sp.]|nr:nucleotidyl transferase AbiEii/AbiGii toxin family protein [Holophaga sp.]